MSASANLFSVLGIEGREDSVTNAIVFGFNHSTTFASHMLSKIQPGLETRYGSWKAHARIDAGVGIPDILLVGTSDKGAALIIVENKLSADEGDAQTERYASDACIKALTNRLLEGSRPVETDFVYLTLFPDSKSESAAFRTITHEMLLSGYKHHGDMNDAERLIGDWQDLIGSFYQRATVEQSDVVLEKLADDPLEGGFLYYRQLMSSLPIQSDLLLEGTSKESMKGRRIYFALFSKPNWSSGNFMENGGRWLFDNPDSHFNIHIEAQYSVITERMGIYLHYETSPWESETWVRQHVLSEHVDRYWAMRASFVERLAANRLDGWKVGGGWNQVAKFITLDFPGMQAGQCQKLLAAAMDNVASVVDECLRNGVQAARSSGRQ